MRTPKESFQLTGKSAEFSKLRNTEAFEVACDYALLELQHQMPPNTSPSLPTDPYVGLDANAQIWGARRFIEILQNLSEPIKKTEPLKHPTIYR